jgi:hypothetical protein
MSDRIEPKEPLTNQEIAETNSKVLFVRDALPSAWLAYSEQLAESAEAVWSHSPETMDVETKPIEDGKTLITKTFPKPHPYLLLAGFALENILKAILIVDDPTLISTGVLDAKVKSHDLAKLATDCGLLILSEEESELLATCSGAIPYWGRYPIPLHHKVRRDVEHVTSTMRETFNKLHYRLCKLVYDKIKDGWDSGAGAKIDKVRSRKYGDAMDPKEPFFT